MVLVMIVEVHEVILSTAYKYKLQIVIFILVWIFIIEASKCVFDNIIIIISKVK